jgi:hypothetical protein
MYPPPPHEVIGAPGAAGPAGLDAAVAGLFGNGPDPNAPPPDPYANIDRKAILQRFKDAKQDGQELRWAFERQWWRDMLYVLGRQWVFFDTKRNEWRDKRLKKWIPKPVTNEMKTGQSIIRMIFAAVQPGVISRPNGNDPKNIATANAVDGLQPLIHEEHKMDARMRLSDFWVTNLGNAFIFPWWNPDDGEIKPVMHDECLSCGEVIDPTAQEDPNAPPSCPTCMEMGVEGTGFQPVKVGDAPTGRGCTDVVSPLEMLLPSHASTFDECEWAIRVRWRPKSYYLSHYPEIAAKLSFEKQTGERSLHMFKALAAQNDMSTTAMTTGAGQRGQAEGVTEYEYWEKPSALWPRGLFFRVIGDKAELILEDPNQSSPGPIPIVTIKDEPLWPWVHVCYEEFGGRLWASGAITAAIQKQDQLNQLDSHTQLCVQRMGNPIWLEPKGTDVERLTGEPGLVVKYNLLGTSGMGKPERIAGEAVPASSFQLREQYLGDIQKIMGTYDVLQATKGGSGVEAFSALQFLDEKARSRFTAPLAIRGEAYRNWFRIALELERKYGPVERTQSLLGPNGTWSFQTFQQADLMGDVSIVVEDATNVPKTALAKRAAMEQANNMGFVDPTDPDQKYAFMTEMGLTSLVPALDTAKKACLRQQDAFENWAATGAQGVPPLKIQPWDDPFIMLNELKKWANGDKMQALLNDPAMGEMVTQILTMYYQQLSMMTAPVVDPVTGQPLDPAAGGAPAPGHAPGGGQAMSRSNTNSTKPAIANHGAPIAGGNG